MSDDLNEVLERLKAEGLDVPPKTEAALERGLAKYSGQIWTEAQRQLLVEKVLKGLKDMSHPKDEVRSPKSTAEVGETQTSLRAGVLKLLQSFGSPEGLAESLNLPFKIEVANAVTNGAGRFVAAQTDVDEYPGWELSRLYDRKVPRLWRGDEGTNDPVLGAEFAGRWYAAAQTAGDADAARILQDTGRMVALKESGIWQALGDFDDGLGNPYPPFAFNSGMDVDGVSRADCIELGLLDADGNTTDGDAPQGSDFDFGSLIGMRN